MCSPSNVFALFCFVTGQVEYLSPDENAVYSIYESIPEEIRHNFALWEYAPLRDYDYFGWADKDKRKVVPYDVAGKGNE